VEKYNNFYGCPLKVGGMGGFFSTHSLMANALNATPDFNFIPNVNVTALALTQSAENQLQYENVFIIDTMYRMIFIPPGEVYSEYEKMWLPFESWTWIAIAAVVVAGFATIFIVKFFSNLHQMLFGGNNRSPFMNFIDIVINGGQNTNFSENVPRMMLLNMLLWSLIFRQEYSSASVYH
jgi:hypothetical protein